MNKLYSELNKGAWSGATAYTIGDFVSNGGSSYVCISNHTNHEPPNTTYWALIASKGDTGATGSTGPTGPAGADATGDVVGPATNTDNLIPQWNGANSKTLKNGLTLDTDLSSVSGSDDSIPSAKATKTALDLKLNIADAKVENIVNPYKAKAYRNGALTTTSGAFTKITLDAESFDVNNNFTGGTYTVPVTGYYSITAVLNITTTDTDLTCAVYVNGSSAMLGVENTNSYGSIASGVLYLTATNTVEMYYFTTGAKAINVGATKTYMSIHLLSV